MVGEKILSKIRCSGTMTEARFFAFILSHARTITYKWKPRNSALELAKRKYEGEDRRIKWEYMCNSCNDWFIRKDVQIDHIIPCGGMRSFSSIGEWYQRALCEKEGFQVLCKPCHQAKTNSERIGVKNGD